MQHSNTESIELLRVTIADAVRQDEHIVWPVINAQKRGHLKAMEALAEKLGRIMGDQVRIKALEQTNGKRVEIILVAIFEHPELLLGASGPEAIRKQFYEACEILRKVAASPKSAELISISAGDPAQSSDTDIRAPKEIAQLATLMRTHLPESGVEVELGSSATASIYPKRGISQPIQDDKKVILIGEIRAVNDKNQTVLFRGADGLETTLHVRPYAKFRERLLEAQLHQKTVELVANSEYTMQNGIHKIHGGSVIELIKTIDNPIQSTLID